MTTVHCQKTECTHYCGRITSLNRARGHPIDLSILGNPFWYIKDRDESITAYAEYALKRIKTDKMFRETIRDIPGESKLGCFCAPQSCHVDIIIELSKYLKSRET